MKFIEPYCRSAATAHFQSGLRQQFEGVIWRFKADGCLKDKPDRLPATTPRGRNGAAPGAEADSD